MKNIFNKFLAVILAMTLVFSFGATALAVTNDESRAAYVAARESGNWASYFALLDEHMFTSGSRGSAESTGIIGSSSKGAGINNELGELNGNVTWNLKNGVLAISGNGCTMAGGLTYSFYIEPFAKNEHIETIVIGAGVTLIGPNMYNSLPNLRAVIIMNNASEFSSGAFVNCPKLETIIVGADLSDAAFTQDASKIAKTISPTDIASRLAVDYNTSEQVIVIDSRKGDWNSLIAQAATAIADANLPTSVLATLPSELNDPSAAGKEYGPLDGITVSDWALAETEKAYNLGIIGDLNGIGYTLGTDYTRPITRAEFCDLAIQLHTVVYGEKETYGIRSTAFKFNDTSNVNVRKAAALGVINGYGNGNFGPDDLITREQAATILARLADALGKPLTGGTTPFTDKASPWAADAVTKVYNSNIMSGYGDTVFGMLDNYTIEQSVLTMLRIYEYVK